jgi:6-phosphogluconolactonase
LKALDMSTPTRTFVYVSNAADADIACFSLSSDLHLTPLDRVPAGPLVMPMAASSDGRFLHAAIRSAPFSLHTHRIVAATGALNPLAHTPLPDNMVFIALDQTGRWLLCASYSGNTVAVHAVDAEGQVSTQAACFFPTGGVKPHSIRIDPANQWVYVPHLGSDEVQAYPFDARNGQLARDARVSTRLPAGFGPRHFVFSRDGRFLYLLGEMSGHVAVFERDTALGALRLIQSISSLPADSTLLPGVARLPTGAEGAVDFDETKVIWCADLQITPDGRHLFSTERTRDHIGRFAVDTASGLLRFLGQTPTERQPRGIAIDPAGRYLIASGEKSTQLSLYTLDSHTGDLHLKEQVPVGRGANWVQIVQLP